MKGQDGTSRNVRRRASTLAFVLFAGLLLSAPVAVNAVDPSVDLQVSWTRPDVVDTFSPPDALRVGDEVTVHVETVGIPYGVTCYETFTQGPTGAAPFLRAFLGTSGPPPCHDWTFIVPPTAAGPHTLGLVIVASETEQYMPEVPLTVEAGGTPRPVTSNVALVSWDLASLFGADRVRFGETWELPVPANAQGYCDMTLNGSYLTGFTVHGVADSCEPWTVTLPDIRPPAYRTNEPNGYPWQLEYSASFFRDDGTWRSTGQVFADTLLVDDAVGDVTFASSRPAAVFAADDNPYFTYPGPVSRVPRIVGLTEGTCRYEVRNVGDDNATPAGTVPIVDGACAPVEFEVAGNGVFQVFLYLKDAADQQVASAWTGGEVIQPLPAPVIEAPDTADTGTPVEIDASTTTGSPLEYEITPVLEDGAVGVASADGGGARSLAATTQCTGASGTFLLKDADRSATATCTFGVRGTYRISARFIDPTGVQRTTSRLIEIGADSVVPTITNLRQRFVPGSQLGTSAIPVQVAWTAADDTSGVHHARVDQQRDGAAWTVANANLTASTLMRDLYRGHDYRFRVRAVDGAQNTSPFAYTATFAPVAYSETNPLIKYSGAWYQSTSADAYGGALRGTTVKGGSATITFRGRSVAWVSPWSSTRGRAKVYLDGKLVTTVDLYRASLSQRRVAFAWNWTTAGTHTLKIVNEATTGHARIDVDAIVILD